MKLHLLALTFAVLALTACRSIGPGTVQRDRFDYSTALAESWKSQMLLNLVKTRYFDLPVYLEVGQVVSGFSLETSVSVNGQVAKTGAGDQILGTGVGGTFTDRPTITYTPMTGDKFIESFLAPINPAKVFALVQSGYAADFILEVSVDSLNGLRNRTVSIGSRQKPDPDFFRALGLLREIQEAGVIGLRIERPTNAQPATMFILRSERIEPATQEKLVELRTLLGLVPNQSTYRLVQSPLRGNTDELAVHTRSLAQVMAALARGVEVPPRHLQRKLTPPIAVPSEGEDLLLRVRSGSAKSEHAFVAVPYEGEWFWIASEDWKSRRTFISILYLFTLVDAGGTEKLPTITIPAQ